MAPAGKILLKMVSPAPRIRGRLPYPLLQTLVSIASALVLLTLVYRLGEDFMPLGPGEYLDPEAAAAGAAAVANQGK